MDIVFFSIYFPKSLVLLFSLIHDVMVSVSVSSAVDREPWWGKTKDYEIGICCFSTKHPNIIEL